MLASARDTTSPTFKWRPYQAHALDAGARLFTEPGCNPIVVIPTGGGKGPLSAEFSRRYILSTGKRVIVATHVKELVQQNYNQIRRVAPHLNAGIFSASLGRKDRHGQVTIANVQSIASHARSFKNVGLLIIDEAHLLQHGEDGQYHQLIKGLRSISPDLIVLGLTATPWRLNSGNLIEPFKGVEPLFNEVAYEIGIAELVADGYLTRIVPRSTKVRQNTTGVRRAAGEFAPKELNEAVNVDELNIAITDEVIDAAEGRKAILDFCVGIDHAERVAKTYNDRGIPAAFVSGDMAAAERDRIINSFKAGRTRVLANCGILTTGFDHPAVDCIVHRRPTNSPGLFLQITGRGTRVVYAEGYDLETREGRLAAIAAGGKPDCLMLDFAQNTMRHGLIDSVRGIHKKGKEADASSTIKECFCGVINARDAQFCSGCGSEFPTKLGGAPTAAEREAKLHKSNTAEAVMNENAVEFQVLGMRYSRHTKEGAPDSFKVSFTVPGEPWPISVWWLFNAEGWGKKTARLNWRKFTDGGKPPNSVDEAIARAQELKYPARIWASRRGSFWTIEGMSFDHYQK